MVYEKKVKYLDYFEGGMRVGGGGFIKLERRDGTLRMELTLTGLHHTDTFARDVVLCGRDREESCGRIEISAGRGQYRQQWNNVESIGGTGIGYGELCGVRIPLGAGRQVSGRWQADGGNALEETGKTKRQAAGREEVRRHWDESGRKIVDQSADASARGALEQEAAGRGEAAPEKRAASSGAETAWSDKNKQDPDKEKMFVEQTVPGEALQEAAEKSRYENPAAGAEAVEPGEIRVEAFQREAETAPAREAYQEERSRVAAIREEDNGAAAWQNAGNESSDMGANHGEEAARDQQPNATGGELQGSSMEAAVVIETWMQKGTEDMMGGSKRAGDERHREISRRQEPDRMDDNGVRGERFINREAGMAGRGSAQLMNREGGSERTMVAGKNQHNEDNGRNRPEAVKGSGRKVEWKEESVRQRKPPGESAKPAPVKLMEDKWSQLWAIYPHIRPFQDAREYLSIGPGDFVLFSEAFYKAANNSFLLHGYYNYRHLLLARVERKGEYAYYIGVPGNFYEREKQVAIMFGFESFECAEEPAQAGDFGYYMMRAQI